MKKFNFKLQKILQLRKFREDECKIELGRAVSALNEIERKMMETASTRRLAALDRFSSQADMHVWDNYILRLDQEAERLAREAAAAELVVEEKRAAYLQASREVKAIDKLREKREKEHRKEMFAAQTAELDSLPYRMAT
ncbi:MAG: flagellar export protein FliJ [Treponema sp.]|nr:flagellar export protein FliJ [Treponema sp.]